MKGQRKDSDMDEKEQDRIKALEVAMNNEAREREFYLRHSERTRHPLGKEMFRTLAEEEQEHMERIRLLHRRLEQQGRWPEDVPVELKGTRVKNVLDSVVESIRKIPDAERDDLEAVRVAMEFEAKGEAFYSELARKADDPREKEFFALLSSLEHEHLVSLKDTQEFFRNPEGWYTAKERHSLDGGA
jgi:rubrerythrin